MVDVYGIDYFGNIMGVVYKDDFMGLFIILFMVIGDKNGCVEVIVNVCMLCGKMFDVLCGEIVGKINVWVIVNYVVLEINYD